MMTQRKWFGVTNFKYRPVGECFRRNVRRRLAIVNREAAFLERAIHAGKRGMVAKLEYILARAQEIESELYMKLEE